MTPTRAPSTHKPASGPRALLELGIGLLRRLREAHDAQVELQERAWLRQEPWLEELLHWSYDGERWRLHGSLVPPPNGRRRSVTRSGWCPCTVPAPGS